MLETNTGTKGSHILGTTVQKRFGSDEQRKESNVCKWKNEKQAYK